MKHAQRNPGQHMSVMLRGLNTQLTPLSEAVMQRVLDGLQALGDETPRGGMSGERDD